MQAIFEATDAEAISWDRLSGEAGKVVSLDTAQRWRQQPELGDWILHARGELRAGRTLPLQTAPSSVTVRYLPDVACVGFGHGNAGVLVGPVQEFVRNATGSAAILSRHNNHVWGLHIAASGQLRLNEGSEFSEAYELIEKATAELGHAKPMAICLIEHVCRVSTGMDHAKHDSILASLQDGCIDYGRRQVVKDFLSKFEPLYAHPDLSTFCEVAKAIVTTPPTWLTIRMPVSMRLLGQVRPMPGDDAIACLDEVVARIKAGARKLSRSVSTIHKAKGLEFENVLIGNFSAAHFGDDELSRKLAYVALSRAQRAITILVPGNNPSPLLRNRHA
jgi:DNA helicase-2/ATP-dependent DNA helicase PcrA